MPQIRLALGLIGPFDPKTTRGPSARRRQRSSSSLSLVPARGPSLYLPLRVRGLGVSSVRPFDLGDQRSVEDCLIVFGLFETGQKCGLLFLVLPRRAGCLAASRIPNGVRAGLLES